MAKKVIIGINYGSGHDSSAAIIADGKLIAIGEEERFTRKKHDNLFPYKSIEFCLSEAGVKPEEVTHACIGWDKWTHFGKKLLFAFGGLKTASVWRRLKFIRILVVMAMEAEAKMRQMFPNAKIYSVEHHMAHAASTYYTSDFDESAIISWDGRGEWSTGFLAIAKGNNIKKLKETYYPVSYGMLYTAFTHYLGFDSNDEYKVMGLSAYGKPIMKDKVKSIVRFSDKNVVDIDLSYFQHPGFSFKTGWGEKYFTEKLEQELGPARRHWEPINDRYENVAASLQQCYNEIGVEVAKYLSKQTNCKNLCITGGVGLNGVMNMAIMKNSGFKDFHFISAPDDAGVGLGAALWVHHVILSNTKRIKLDTPYWGISFSDEFIRKEIENYRYRNVIKLNDPAKTAANLLSKGYIIGWFQGRAEFGPRALGNRSIIGDPRPAEFKDIVNARIKFREEFRPFAPSVLAEYAHEYFDLPGDSPYMLQICDVVEQKRSEIQAVTHVNGSARPQTVRREVNPLYYDLIKNFFEITGTPLILNTSFNVKGEPIVNSPSDALRCFYATGLDYLIMGNYLFHKNLDPNLEKDLK